MRELCKTVLLLNICVIEILKSSSRHVGTAVSKSLFPKAFGIDQKPWFFKALYDGLYLLCSLFVM